MLCIWHSGFAGTCDGTAVEDCAGVCGGDSVIGGCDNVCGSTAVEDECGVCGGSGPDENSSCNGIFKPESTSALKTAVDLWVDDNSLALSTYGEINTWDVSLIQDMSTLFSDKFNFNDDISNWDVSNVTTMNSMFSGANAFSQDLSSWDVSNVVIMEGMFRNAANFNGNISNWNVSNVTTMNSMFSGANAFIKIYQVGMYQTWLLWKVCLEMQLALMEIYQIGMYQM